MPEGRGGPERDERPAPDAGGAPEDAATALDEEDDLSLGIAAKPPILRSRAGIIRNVLATIAIGIVIAGLVWFFERPGDDGSSEPITLTAAASGPPPRVDEEAPDFQVQGLDGESIRLSDYRGSAVWINFWASWCPPCRAESPEPWC